MAKWKISDIPDLSGKRVIITGANTGLGFKSALELARKNASVIIACRRLDSGEEAVDEIKKNVVNAKISCAFLDLTDKNSIESFANDYIKKYDRLDILINNAAVVNLKDLSHTKDGYEMHMATNHYGHFILTNLLFPIICKTKKSRVITVTSGAYKIGQINFDDINWNKRKYSRVKAYGDSKLANILFARYLQKKFDDVSCSSLSLLAHPGLTATPRQQSIGIGGKFSKWLASPVELGVAPQLMAATHIEAQKNDFYGPRFGIRGGACKIKLQKFAKDDELALQLWKFSEKLF